MQANKAGLMEIADVFVINKADRKGVAETRRDLELMLDLSELGEWRPPIVTAVATDGTGVRRRCGRRCIDHRRLHGRRAVCWSSGASVADCASELRQIVTTRLETRARELCRGDHLRRARGSRCWTADLDPWAAADELLREVDA